MTLSPEHRAYLNAAAITDEVLDRVGVRSVPSGMKFPWRDRNGTTVTTTRPDDPGDGPKYLWPKDVPPILWQLTGDDDRSPVVIVEGHKQSLAVASWVPDGYAVYGINGCWGWSSRDELPDVSWTKGRDVLVMLDADLGTNDNVGLSGDRFVERLGDEGAASVTFVPNPGTGTDGWDDVLARIVVPGDRTIALMGYLMAAGTTPTPSPDERFEARVTREVERLQVIDEAQRRHKAAQDAEIPSPWSVPLADLLDEPDETPQWRVNGLLVRGGFVVLAAQRKAGKTTFLGNLIRSLADGDPFLAAPSHGLGTLGGPAGYAVDPVADGESIVLVDLELTRPQLRRWLRLHKVTNHHKVHVIPLRGRAGQFDILDPKRRAAWIDYLTGLGTKTLIVDPLRPLMDALGLDENHDASKVLGALTEISEALGGSETIVSHHMGHTGERSRGDSKLRDHPDAEWKLVYEGQNGSEPPANAVRFFSAMGRDVEVPETQLAFDAASKRMWLARGNRVEHAATKKEPAVLAFLGTNPGAGVGAVEAGVVGNKAEISKTLQRLVQDGRVVVRREGARNAHYLADAAGQPSPSVEAAG